ncbi:hypothetical protein [Parasitella parasitica]|uniref:Uncharacterized protein n=1 Tax=Parasitella parasitica TaxID=35722 RepID=A0A0B7N7K4_9FUNG|nr:hypothetical protein [Parasitella parasitica]
MLEIESDYDEEPHPTLTIKIFPGPYSEDGSTAARVDSYFRANSGYKVAVLPSTQMLDLFKVRDVDANVAQVLAEISGADWDIIDFDFKNDNHIYNEIVEKTRDRLSWRFQFKR